MGMTHEETFPGEDSQVGEARRFVAKVLDGCPVADDAVLLTSEVATNAVEHTESGGGGSFEVTVRRGEGSAVVEVRDGGGYWSRPRVLVQNLDDDESEQGRGLAMVELMAHQWGCHGDAFGRVIWFELVWETGPGP